MTNTLIVIKPFYTLGVGDTLELSEDKQTYVASHTETMANSIDDGNDIYGSYSTALTISAGYAKELVEEGFLKCDDSAANKKFVNVFTEIDSLLNKYQYDLVHVDESCKDMPECVKVEKITVLNNVIKVLNYLKNLKK